MTDLTREELERLDELERKATPGPWRVNDELSRAHDKYKTGDTCVDGAAGESLFTHTHGWPSRETPQTNSELICALRNAYPALRALAQRAEPELECHAAPGGAVFTAPGEPTAAWLDELTPVAPSAMPEEPPFIHAKLTEYDANVRELEGGLKRVLAYSRFTGGELCLDLAREALRDPLAIQNRQVSVENIQKTVADYYKIKVSEMYSKRRSRNVARPRQIAMALAKELTQLSLPDIGEAFGGRDHTTVLHACRRVALLKSSNTDVTHDFNSLLKVLRSANCELGTYIDLLRARLQEALEENVKINDDWNERYGRMMELEERLTKDREDLAELHLKEFSRAEKAESDLASSQHCYNQLAEHHERMFIEVQDLRSAQAEAREMREALQDLLQQVNHECERKGEGDFYTGKAISALAARSRSEREGG